MFLATPVLDEVYVEAHFSNKLSANKKAALLE